MSEYWDGLRWTGILRSDAPPLEALDESTRLRPTPPAAARLPVPTGPSARSLAWTGASLGALWLLLSLSVGSAGFLVAAGVIAMITAAYVVITGRRSWARIPSRQIGGLFLAIAVAVTAAGVATTPRAAPLAGVHLEGSSASEASEASEATRSPSPIPSPTRSRVPVVLTEEAVVTEPIPYEAVTVDDGALAAGVVQVTTTGVPGTRTLTYRVTKTDGKETGRELISDVVSVAPITEVTSNGTYVAPAPPPAPVRAAPSGCDSNYSGPCVPIASDVDCEGGSGNGPAYVRGPVWVVGSDIYDLDRDGDGVGCD